MQLQVIQKKIYEIRGQKVMLDYDLAELYAVPNKALKQAIKRNIVRFPSDFMFELSTNEFERLRSQIVTSNRGGIRYLPFAFTEQGIAMLSSVLKNKKAVEVNIAIMRAFVFIRNYALSHKDLTNKLKKLERKYSRNFKDIYEAINYLLNKDTLETEQKKRKRIGYNQD